MILLGGLIHSLAALALPSPTRPSGGFSFAGEGLAKTGYVSRIRSTQNGFNLAAHPIRAMSHASLAAAARSPSSRYVGIGTRMDAAGAILAQVWTYRRHICLNSWSNHISTSYSTEVVVRKLRYPEYSPCLTQEMKSETSGCSPGARTLERPRASRHLWQRCRIARSHSAFFMSDSPALTRPSGGVSFWVRFWGFVCPASLQRNLTR